MTEIITYKESGRSGEVEFRRYPSIILATVSGSTENENFWILFRYITGNNRSQKKVPMTAPVISDADTMSFVLPASYQREDVPEPVDSRISIQEVPPRELAVIRFSGRASTRDVAEVRERLLTTLDAEKIPVAGRPFLMRYNAPYTPGFLRRNEVGVEIKRGN